ncbi:MAG TPA: hypothetical protein VFG10_04030 [Saprospiraceae bacterium]|nr:hypothetical protein [Saprospiraceae bacterium]
MELEKFKILHARFNKVGTHGIDTTTPEFEEYIDAIHSNRECSDWYMTSTLQERKFDYTKHCCLMMALQISQPNTMPDGKDDHDIIMNYNEIFDEYGIPIYDGGTSVLQIMYCPWCGNKLPVSKRDQWFEKFGELAYEDDNSKIPDQYRSDQWWRNSNDL